ncbi:unnamed protein product, partial [Meganyctiphanes norvegica]
MAGTLPTDSTSDMPNGMTGSEPQRKNSRKQWSAVQGGPRGLLRRMRSQLAEEGCPESQLVMARALLEQGESSDEVSEEDCRLGVYWLTQAALQGNTEANQLLQECLDNSIGICEHNYQEVVQVLAMDQQEKLVRRATKLLFNSVADGNEFTTSSSLSHKIHEIVSGENQKEDEDKKLDNDNTTINDDSLEQKYGGERFTEQHILSSGLMYINGYLPPLNHFIERSPYHKTKVPELVYKSFMLFMGKTAIRWTANLLHLSILWYTVMMMFCIAAVCALGLAGQVLLLPGLLSSLVYIVSIVAMMLCSARMMVQCETLGWFQCWSKVFQHFSSELDIVEAERSFKLRCWKPFALHFLALIVHLASSLQAPSWLSTWCWPPIVAFSLLSLIMVPEQLSLWHFASFITYLSAITPILLHWLSPLALSVANLVGLQSLFVDSHVEIIEGIELHAGVGPVFHSVWLCLQAGLVINSGFAALPRHLVSITWTHLAVSQLSIVYTTLPAYSFPPSLVSATLLWSGLSLVPTFPNLATVGLPSLAAGWLLHHKLPIIGEDGFSIVAFIISTLFVLVVIYAARNYRTQFVAGGKLSLLVLLILTSLQPSLIVQKSFNTGGTSNLKWESYQNTCIPSKVEVNAVTEAGCRPLVGTMVKWRGKIDQIEVSHVTNVAESINSLFPDAFGNHIRCLLGETHKQHSCDMYPKTSGAGTRCELIQKTLPPSCSLSSWDHYNFDITVTMEAYYSLFDKPNSKVVIRASDEFRKFLLGGIRPSDEVEFVASLAEGVGSPHLTLELSSISCIRCQIGKLPAAYKSDFFTSEEGGNNQ